MYVLQAGTASEATGPSTLPRATYRVVVVVVVVVVAVMIQCSEEKRVVGRVRGRRLQKEIG